ncbi:unnamed protein product [Brassica rapa subsp. trilocularis]
MKIINIPTAYDQIIVKDSSFDELEFWVRELRNSR